MKKGVIKVWFTLVELIVVITILAILWTISFVSFQWYSKDARNSKRMWDLTNIQKTIELKKIEWISLDAFVKNNSSLVSTTIKYPNDSFVFSIKWFTWSVFSTFYNAGDLNSTSLWINEDDLKDPLVWEFYKIGTINFKRFSAYELAATFEWDKNYAYVKWNWNPRIDAVSWLYVWWSSTISEPKKFKITNTSDYWKIKKWDQVIVTNYDLSPYPLTTISEVSQVSESGDFVYFANDLPGWDANGVDALSIIQDESLWLIKAAQWDGPVFNGDTNYNTPYYIN